MNTPAATHTLACVSGAGFFLGEGRKSLGRVRGEKERKRCAETLVFYLRPQVNNVTACIN